MTVFDDARAREDLQVLVGSRARGRPRAAVRIEDISAMVELAPSLMAAKAEGATVSAAEFNALRDDVQAMHDILLAVAAALSSRLRG